MVIDFVVMKFSITYSAFCICSYTVLILALPHSNTVLGQSAPNSIDHPWPHNRTEDSEIERAYTGQELEGGSAMDMLQENDPYKIYCQIIL